MPTAPAAGTPASPRRLAVSPIWFTLIRMRPRPALARQHSSSFEHPGHAHFAWIDVAKGLGILMVVFGHLTSNLYVMKFFMLASIPLFFFISGYLHKPEPRLLRFAHKKAIRFLVPYATFLLLLSFFRFIHVLHHHQVTRAWLARGFFDLLWGGPRLTGIFSVSWFLTCLFLTQVSTNWLLVRCRMATVASVVAAALLLSYANAAFLPAFSLPLDANAVASAAPFFLAGFLCRTHNFNRWLTTALGLLGCAVSLDLLAQGLPIFYDMHTGFYGTPLLTVMLAQGCVFACWQLSILLSKTPLLSPLLQSIGAMSLGIMLLHKAVPFLPGYSRLQGHTESSAFVAALVSSWLLSLLLNRFSLTRALFLGSEKDWNGLLRPTAVLRETTATARA